MRNIYDASITEEMMDKVLPSHFRIVNDKTSNGYKFMNALYGIELTGIEDYLDQAMHYSSFENFDYGLDYNFSTVKFPRIINSGFVYGEVNNTVVPIKITTNEEFMDGMPTRMVYDSNSSITLTGYIQSSGNVGLEYMRIDKNGSGVLFINSILDSATAVLSNTYQTYKLPIDDLLKPDFTSISGVNFGIDYQNYDSQQRYELLNPELEDTLQSKYAASKKVSLPGGGIANKPNQYYTVDFYKPEGYYWDEQLDTYKAIVPQQDKYYDNEVEVYHRQYLNNPNGSGVYNVSYLNLEFVPISGTLKLFDIDTLTSGQLPTEIMQSGTNVYIYDAISDGTTTPYYTYIGYEQEVPVQEALGFPATGVLYKVTSWNYVREKDGLVNFDWVSDPTKPITNKIKIVNPIGRYIVEYTYVVDKQHNAITTATANRYVKYDKESHIFSSVDTTNNAVIVPNKLSVEKDTRRAVTFDGKDIRPGSVINELQLRGVLNAEISEIVSSSTINVSKVNIPGYRTNIIPNPADHNEYVLNHHYTNQVLLPVSGVLNDVMVGDTIGKRIYGYNKGIQQINYYDLYSDNITANKILRMRFRPQTSSSNYILMESIDTDNTGWSVAYNNGFIVITDGLSTISSAEDVLFNNDIVDMILVAQGSITDTLSNLRYGLYISLNGNFHKNIPLFESSINYYIGKNISKTVAFANTSVDLDYIQIYNEGNINGNNIL